MKSILFVDDEPRILDGLRDMLHRKRKTWHMVFAEGAEAALAELARNPFDVVVSDMRMPHTDGATLLARVRDTQPQAVRIILSGFTDAEAAVRAVPVAHQFLSKPCDRETLERVVERACAVQATIGDERLRRTLGTISDLPSRPTLYQELVTRLQEPETTTRDIAQLIEQDMAICAKILQLVNSSFFGMPRRIQKVEDAVLFLGQTMILNLALSATAFHTERQVRHLSVERLQTHALLTGSIARRLVPDAKQADDAFLAGVLHDIGILILASRMPEDFERILARARRDSCPLHVAEAAELGVTHSEMGAYLLGLWGMSSEIVGTVAFHHRPLELHEPRFDVVTATAVADTLAYEVMNDRCSMDGVTPPPLDLELVQALGMTEEIPRWRELAREVAADLMPEGRDAAA